MTAPNESMNSKTMLVDKALMHQIGRMLGELGTGQVPFTSEIEALKKTVGVLLENANAAHLMQGRYRCPKCHNHWVLENELNDARDCQRCGEADVEPYFSGDPNDFNATPLYALAEHERRYPAPGERGSYTVEVHRTAFRSKEITIHDAIGPATAKIQALVKAPDEVFSSDIEAEYHAEGWEFDPALVVGEKYLWNDPDDGQCSNEVTITAISNGVIRAVSDSGSFIEALPAELSRIA